MTAGEHLSPTARLLLASAGPRGIAALPSLESSAIDWEILLTLALQQRATWVLWRQIRDEPALSVPDEYRERFERLAMIARFRAGRVADRLEETLAAFADADIEVVLLKGAGLAMTVYPSFAERAMGDLDLLIRAADMPRALAASRRAGWMEAPDMFPADGYERHHHGPPLIDGTRAGVGMELHTDLFAPGHRFGLSVDELIQSSEHVRAFPGRVLVPSRMHNLLHVCIHFSWSHMMRFGVWRMLRDVSALTADELRWDDIVTAATQHRAATCCYWSLRLTRSLAKADIPDAVLSALSPYKRAVVLDPLARHLELQVLPSELLCPSEQLNATLWRAAIRPRHSGHDEVLPSSPSVATVPIPMAPALTTRVARQAVQVAAWWRYLRHVLLAPPRTG